MDRADKAVAQWRVEKPHLNVQPMETIGRVNEAAAVLTRDWHAPVFSRFGLQPGEFDVLATLRRSGKPYALAPTSLYEATMVSSGAMTNRVDQLEKAGLVHRQPNPEDRRGVVVRLTDKGLSVIDEAIEVHVANQHRMLSGLTEGEQIALAGLLKKLIVSLNSGRAS